MRRAVAFPALLLTALLPGSVPHAAEVERAPDVIDGAGLVQYMQRPDFAIGTWAKYHVTGKSARGHSDDYTVTLMVAGEEVFWGEPCFWLETWTEKKGRKRPTASLISYSAFGDTMARKRPMWFLRKTINGYDQHGKPDIVVYTRQAGELKLRKVNWEQEEEKVSWDTLGTGSTNVPAGDFEVLKVVAKTLHAETAEKGDSSIYYERRFHQVQHFSPKVPLTHLVRLDTEDVQQGKTWLAGKFDRGNLNVLERVDGSTVLVGFGTTGVEPNLVPKALRKPIDRKLVEQVLGMPAEAPVRVLPRRGGGR